MAFNVWHLVLCEKRKDLEEALYPSTLQPEDWHLASNFRLDDVLQISNFRELKTSLENLSHQHPEKKKVFETLQPHLRDIQSFGEAIIASTKFESNARFSWGCLLTVMNVSFIVLSTLWLPARVGPTKMIVRD